MSKIVVGIERLRTFVDVLFQGRLGFYVINTQTVRDAKHFNINTILLAFLVPSC